MRAHLPVLKETFPGSGSLLHTHTRTHTRTHTHTPPSSRSHLERSCSGGRAGDQRGTSSSRARSRIHSSAPEKYRIHTQIPPHRSPRRPERKERGGGEKRETHAEKVREGEGAREKGREREREKEDRAGTRSFRAQGRASGMDLAARRRNRLPAPVPKSEEEG